MTDKNVIHKNIIEVNVENRPTKLIHRNNVIRIDYLQYESGKYRIWIYFLNIIINEKEWIVTYDTDYLPYIKWFDNENYSKSKIHTVKVKRYYTKDYE